MILASINHFPFTTPTNSARISNRMRVYDENCKRVCRYIPYFAVVAEERSIIQGSHGRRRPVRFVNRGTIVKRARSRPLSYFVWFLRLEWGGEGIAAISTNIESINAWKLRIVRRRCLRRPVNLPIIDAALTRIYRERRDYNIIGLRFRPPHLSLSLSLALSVVVRPCVHRECN